MANSGALLQRKGLQVANDQIQGQGSRSTEWWKVLLVFALATIGAAGCETILFRYEVLIALGILVLVYFLGSLRFLPWKTPLRKAFSIGIGVGMLITLVFWKFGIGGPV